MAVVAPSSTSPGSPADDLTGQVLAGRYRLNHPIASGGMAQVWEATDEVLARRVAVKVLHPHLARDESFVRRFRGEAIAAARLAHPSIVSVYDTLSEGWVNAIVMELVSGTTMRADLDQHGPLQLSAVLAIGTQVADALGAAHASGLVHRDVKPANILLSADGRVLVADFGIAKAAEGADLTNDGSMVGTAKYLAPEQVEGGPIDGRTDLYALGVVLYEALTGTPPFVADTDTGTALARLHRDPVPPRQLRPQIPPSVELVVTRALARRPADRFPDAAAFRRALLAAGADPSHAPAAAQAAVAAVTGERPAASRLGPPPPAPPRSATPPPLPPPVPPPAGPQPHEAPEPPEPEGRRRWPRVLVALVLLVAIGGGIATLTRGGGSASNGANPGRALAIGAVRDFDPNTNDRVKSENPDQLGAITDGDPATAWSTERYRSPDLRKLKGGVGLIATVDATATLDQVAIETPVGGWSAQVYVTEASTPPTDLAGWGEAVASVDDVTAGTVKVRLGGRTGKAVLIWFTKLANNGPQDNTAQVSGLAVRGS